jgi:meso-butanediol dehydrogenase / (S,S)-butanediol dehydrogenase / diacetyl reductase
VASNLEAAERIFAPHRSERGVKGKVVFVTGGARGIGRGIAQAFLKVGARVVVGDLGRTQAWSYALSSEDDRNAAIASDAQLGEVAGVELDVTSARSARDAIETTLARFGRLDVLVNNAGVVQSGAVDAFPEADWDRTFAVNAKGPFLMTQAALPALLAAGDACVINIASIAGKQGYRNMSAYCASKFAVIGFTQSLAAELAPRGVRVNAICPGMLGTAMWLDHLLPPSAPSRSQGTNRDAKQEEFEKMMAGLIPLGRPQTPEDIAEAALYLARAKNVTGVSLSVAGGYEMN